MKQRGGVTVNDNSLIYLSNINNYREIMIYNISTNEKQVVQGNVDLFEISGKYIVDGTDNYVMLYKKNSTLRFQTKNQEYPLQEENCKVHFKRDGENNVFWIEILDSIVFSITYRSLSFDPVNMADINFNDDMEELQDIYLFTYNLMQDREWQKRIYTNQ